MEYFAKGGSSRMVDSNMPADGGHDYGHFREEWMAVY
jgi:hypothetical protein